MITIESSTIIPSTTMSAANVTVFKGMPHIYMIPTEMNVAKGIVIAATRAGRKGNKIIMTRIIITIAIINSCRKEETESPTTFA